LFDQCSMYFDISPVLTNSEQLDYIYYLFVIALIRKDRAYLELQNIIAVSDTSYIHLSCM
jgi:hypothetical protein